MPYEKLRDTLKSHHEMRSLLYRLDPEEQPARYAAFIAKVTEQTLRQEINPDVRLAPCKRLIDLISGWCNLSGISR